MKMLLVKIFKGLNAVRVSTAALQNNFRVQYSTEALKTYTVNTLLKEKPVNIPLNIKGWVKSIRKQKQFTFFHIDDGSSFHKLQVIMKSELCPEDLGFHCSVSINGDLCESTHPAQEVDFWANEIKVIGPTDPLSYPFKARTMHLPEQVRLFPHLRVKTNTFSSLLRIRAQAKQSIQKYFNEEGFLNVDTPIITRNDCEGGGEVFHIEPNIPAKSNEENKNGSQKENLKTNDIPEEHNEHYFNHPVYLTVSGQLHLEAIASGMTKVYNFSPAFRAEYVKSRRHLNEFWMIEAEEAFLEGQDGFKCLLDRVEDVIKTTIQNVLDLQADDVYSFWKKNELAEVAVKSALNKTFVRLPYVDALNILQDHGEKFQELPVFGGNLQREHELFLVDYFGTIPIFVINWPLSCKAFYTCSDETNPEIALGMDLLVPDVGELAGGGLREHRLDVIQHRLQGSNFSSSSFDWYLDLRKYGSSPSGGFGIGFERFLQFLLGIPNVRDTVPFPRWAKNCIG